MPLTYILTISSNNKTTTIQSPIAIRFNILRQIDSQSNKAVLELYNLSKSIRNAIQDSIFEKKEKYLTLQVNNSLVFSGMVLQSYSYKLPNRVDIVTRIEAAALDIFDCQASFTFDAGTTFKEAYKQIASCMPNVNIANIGALEGTFKTPATFDGNALDELNKLTGGHTFVDNNTLNTIFDNEMIYTPKTIIADNSILDRSETTAIILFNPVLIIGQLLKFFNSSQYKIISITHDCLISPTQPSKNTTTLTLIYINTLPSSDIALTGGGAQAGAGARQGDEPWLERHNDGDVGRSPSGASVEAALIKGEERILLNPKGPQWIMPCKGRISSYYGKRKIPVKGASDDHKGIDIAVPVGTPVKAVAAGKVIAQGPAKGYGRWVKLDHGKINGKTITSEYGHISLSCVKSGQWVKQGQVIAKSGNEGTSKGAHLHLTIKVNNVAKDPLLFLPKW